MLLKKNRADRGAVQKIFKEGKFFSSQNLIFRFVLGGNLTPPRISFIAPKSIVKLAVERNLLRRCGYHVLSGCINDFPLGIMGVFVFKKKESNLAVIESEVRGILNKLK